MDPKDLILVCGATGRQGGAVARELLRHGHPVRAMTRNPDSPPAQALAALGAELVRADFDDAASLERAVAGAWGVYSVQDMMAAGVEGEERHGVAMAEAARRAGVRRFVQASVASAHRGTGIPHFESKWRVEGGVRSMGFPWHAVLRPAFFMENFTAPWLLPAIEAGRLPMALAPTTRLQMIAVADIGRHARRLFEGRDLPSGLALDIAGDERTLPETAETLGRSLGRTLEFVREPIEAVRAYSPDYATMLEWLDAVGYDVDLGRLARDTGITPTTLEQWSRGLRRPETAAP